MTGSPGALTPTELDALLGGPILARLATIDPAGWPAVVPVWFEWDGEAVWIVARARAGYVGDLKREPRVCLSVVADDDPDRRAQIFGRAEFIGDPGPLDGRGLEIARRMAVRYEGGKGLQYVERSLAWERALIRIVPVRIVSWRSPEWHARYRKPVGDTGPTQASAASSDPSSLADRRSP